MKYLIMAVLLFPFTSHSYDNRVNFQASPNDYLFKDRERKNDDVFADYRRIELGIDLGIGADCGKLDVHGTLKSTIDRVLDPSFFGNAVENITGAAPLLTLCYMSPTACSLAKHFRLNGQWMSQLRLDQCALVDKYVDSRVEDHYAERQKCVQRELQKNGGNPDKALSACGGGGLYQANLSNWAGQKYGDTVQTNKLIESSARWAGFTSPGAKRAVNLVKAFVGDSTVSKGKVTVEYGPRQVALAPREHFRAIKKETFEKLCGDIMEKISKTNRPHLALGNIAESELAEINENNTKLIDRQTLYYLSLLPRSRRDLYCEKLSTSIALNKFSDDASRSLQLLTELSQNPNLPQNRKSELIAKQRMFKNSVEMMMSLKEYEENPINQVAAQINHEGRTAEAGTTHKTLKFEANTSSSRSLKSRFFDCSDPSFCKGGN